MMSTCILKNAPKIGDRIVHVFQFQTLSPYPGIEMDLLGEFKEGIH